MKYLLLTLTILSLQTGFAQIYDWTVYNTDNSGIAYDWVNAVAEGPDGEIWVGTEYGLSRFDGLTWDTFYTTNSGLPGDVIRCLLFDGNGDLWVGTFLGGLAKYDGSSWTVFNTANSLLPDDFVRSMAIDQTGVLWVGTTGGLAKYDPVMGFTEVYNTTSSDIPGNNIPTILVDDDNSIWVGTINGGLGHLDGKSWESWTIANSDLIDNTILDLDKDDGDNLWLATPAGGLVIRSAGGAFLNFGTFNSGIADNDVAQVELDSNYQGIIGLSAFGIDFYDGMSWNHIDSANSDLPDNYIQVLFQDAMGILWVGTEAGGLAKGVPLGDTTVSSINGLAAIELNLFPNPTSDWLMLRMEQRTAGEMLLRITDLNGRIVSYEKLDGGVSNQLIDVSSLAEGLYSISISVPPSMGDKNQRYFGRFSVIR